MSLQIRCAEGLPPSTQYRALALSAALARHHPVELSPDADGRQGLWLLEPACQLALMAARDVAALREPAVPAPAPRRRVEGILWLTALSALEAGLPLPAAALVLDGMPGAQQVLEAGVDWLFAIGPPGARAPWPEAEALPRPVAAALLSAPPAPGRGIVWRGGGPLAGQRVAAVRAAAARLNVSFVTFEPHEELGAASALSGRWGAAPPSARRALWQGAALCLVDDDVDATNDAFVDEAQAMGVCVVPAHTLWQQAPAGSGSEGVDGALALCLEARAQGRAPAEALPAPAFVSFDALAERLLDGLAAPPPCAEDASLPRPSQRLVMKASAAALAEAAGPAEPEAAYALVLFGAAPLAEADGAPLSEAYAYEHVFAHLAEHAGIASGLAQQCTMARLSRGCFAPNHFTGVDDPERVVDGVLEWLGQDPRRIAHVLFDPRAGLSHRRLAARLASLADARGRPFRLLLDAKVPRPLERVAGATIGVAVAGTDLARGVSWAAAQAGTVQVWPRDLAHGPSARTVLPPIASLPPREAGDQRVLEAVARARRADEVRGDLEADAIDAVFSPSGPFTDGLLAMRNAHARWPVPVVGVLHSIHGLQLSQQLLAQQVLTRTAPEDGFVSPTECGRRALLAQWHALAPVVGERPLPAAPPRVDVVPYGILTAFYRGRDRAACRAMHGLPQAACTFIQVGRFNRREKGDLVPLLLAFQEVRARVPEARLILVGQPANAQELPRLRAVAEGLGLGESLDIRTGVAPEQKAQLLAAADVFVSASDNIQETYGLVLLEAMAAGLPVVAPAWNGFRELVVHGETGLLVDCQWCDVPREQTFLQQASVGQGGYGWQDLHETVAVDVAGLAAAMQQLAAAPAARQAMGRAAARHVAAHHDTNVQGRAIVAVLQDRAERARARAADWQRPPTWQEPVAASFRHYANVLLNDDTEVVATALGRQAAARRLVLDAMQLASDNEEAAIVRFLQRAAHGPESVRGLGDARIDRLRLMRCLKFGLVRLAP